MSEEQNAYGSPSESANPIESGVLSAAMISNLKGAYPWIRFIGIIGFICSGLYVLGAIAMIAKGAFFASVFNNAFGSATTTVLSGELVGGLYGFFFIVSGALLFLPAFFTFRFGSKLRSYFLTYNNTDLEIALKSNWSLWKFMGILTIISLAFVPVATIISIAAIAAANLGA